MGLADIYARGEAALRQKEIGFFLDGVETEFILENDRRVLDRYTFRQQCIDAVEADTRCRILGVDLATPVVMSAMTMPIPSMGEDALEQVARGLKNAGSLMWTGTPIPQNLARLAAVVPLAANVKPFSDRKKMFEAVEAVQKEGVHWVGIEIDSGQGTKVKDRQMAKDCTPLQSKELREIRAMVDRPLIFKGILSAVDAVKAVDAGADAIVVSNHGAHTLDYLPHPLQVMDEIVAAVGGRTVIIVDGGFRRGSDVLKGLAFDARLVGLGRPILYGLAADGERGVQAVIEEITGELKRLMTMTHTPTPAHAGKHLLVEF
ncbi:MAG: alpha-hydroxy-acid oxidizing protein [Desulfacinum sp.]|nr:alpha-hydroxy-acid oxidizing protein [Desulfacinum sp.]